MEEKGYKTTELPEKQILCIVIFEAEALLDKAKCIFDYFFCNQ